MPHNVYSGISLAANDAVKLLSLLMVQGELSETSLMTAA